MKRTVLSIALVAIFGLTASANNPIEKVKKEVKVSESSVTWKGYKVTGEHEGKIGLKSGFLTMEKGKLVG
ncbi:MAG: YceI family protein, partial [Maribacter sp.]